MLERGSELDKMDLYKSDPIKFLVTENGLRPPLAALGGVGENAAKSIAAARDINRPFISQEDLRQRSGVNKSVIEKLADMGVLGRFCRKITRLICLPEIGDTYAKNNFGL